MTLTDLTDRVRAEESLAAERAARAIIASANEAVVVCDAEGRITHVNDAAMAIGKGELVGKLFDEAIPLTLTETTGPAQASDLSGWRSAAAPSGASRRMRPRRQHQRPPDQRGAAFSGRGLHPRLCHHHGRSLAAQGRREKRQSLLMAELDHRVKNTLTLVLSILGRTRERDVESFKDTFSRRIHALAATHNLLANRSWSTLSIGEIVDAELAPYLPAASSRVEHHGPVLRVAPRAAIAAGLIFHELASNAAKYGALSTDNCLRLTVRAGAPGEPATVEWLERDGPRVEEPEQSGFGTTVITRSLSYSSTGGAKLTFEPTGVRCIISIPVEDCRRLILRAAARPVPEEAPIFRSDARERSRRRAASHL